MGGKTRRAPRTEQKTSNLEKKVKEEVVLNSKMLEVSWQGLVVSILN